MPAPARILITSFQPFRERQRNGSQTLGSTLAAALPWHELQHLNLPVTWGSIEEIALPQIDSFQPHIVLGLGEGTPRFLKIETLARNQRSGLDEAQQAPASETIDSQGPDSYPCRWPLPQPLPTTPDDSIAISDDAGRYLCNNALYRYAQSPCPFAGFIHLPPQNLTPNQAYQDQWLPLVLQLLEFAIQKLPPK